MRTLITLSKGALQGVVALIAFAIFIVLEIHVVNITIDLLVNDHGMNPTYSTYIWWLCYFLIGLEIVVFLFRFVFRNIKNFFVNLFN